MKQFIGGRFLTLTSLAVAAALAMQSASTFAQDSPVEVSSASVPPVLAVTYGCPWSVTCGDKTGSGTITGATSANAASSQAMMAAMNWRVQNCGTMPCNISVGPAYPEIPTVLPQVESRDAKPERMSSPDDWVVFFRCRSGNGSSLEFQAAGSTFCEAYSMARNLVCENMPALGGACCCCYRVVQRPCCCNCRSCCR